MGTSCMLVVYCSAVIDQASYCVFYCGYCHMAMAAPG